MINMEDTDNVMKLESVSKYFRGKQGGIVTALDHVNLEMSRGDSVALAGESGSGKTTLGRIAVGLIRANKGSVQLRGMEIGKIKEVEKFRLAQYIHQDPYGSLDPYATVGQVLERPLKYLLNMKGGAEIKKRAIEMLEMVGLDSTYYDKTNQELSGGERQRVLIGRAFIVEPELIVADEPTTMIDFVHRDEVLDLISRLKERHKLTIIFITHDLALAAKMSNRMFVMFKGKIVESGDTKQILDNPQHPYTKLLMSVTPEFLLETEGKGDEARETLISKAGSMSMPPPKGCIYSANCPFVMDKCSDSEPELRGDTSHKVACFLY